MLAVRQVPPDLVERCPRQPARPATFANLKAMLLWTQGALYAGAQCRALSDRQGEWIGAPPPVQ